MTAANLGRESLVAAAKLDSIEARAGRLSFVTAALLPDIEARAGRLSFVTAALLSDIEARLGRLSLVVAYQPIIIQLAGSATGQATVVSEVNRIFLVGSSSGYATVPAATLENYVPFVFISKDVAGAASVTGYLTIVGYPGVGFPIPYPFLGGGKSVHELEGIVRGRSFIGDIYADVTMPLTVATAGQATVTGALLIEKKILSQGQATVTGWLLNRVDENVVELVGSSTGSTSVITSGLLFVVFPPPIGFNRYLYLLNNVGVSFDPIDDDSGDPRFVSQTFVDGDNRLFDRYLYLLNNVGVSFDPTDDDSADPRFVSQVFVDGHTRDDWARYLYLLQNVMKARPVAFGNLTVGPGYRGQETPMPARTPPSQRF